MQKWFDFLQKTVNCHLIEIICITLLLVAIATDEHSTKLYIVSYIVCTIVKDLLR